MAKLNNRRIVDRTAGKTDALNALPPTEAYNLGYVHGLEAAADFVSDFVVCHNYNIKDVILCKFNATTRKRPRKAQPFSLASLLSANEWIDKEIKKQSRGKIKV